MTPQPPQPPVPRMTHRQGQFLSFIHRYTASRGIAPSFEEIGAHFGVTAPSVNSMVKMLERNGLLTRVPGAARTLRVVVPAVLLPDGEFGGPAPRGPAGRSAARPAAPTACAADVAAAACVAVLDALVPLVPSVDPDSGAVDEDARARAVDRAACAAADAARQAGLSADAADELARRLGAEVARWQRTGAA
ncbi:MAG: hypothetical protein HZA54_16310 [Planctomycetes bacterium]|nr:hypothetical protein [Planctomycetota bacterium]